MEWHRKKSHERLLKGAVREPNNDAPIGETCAFTIEPQMLATGLPMASFHIIVAFENGVKPSFRNSTRRLDFLEWKWIGSN